MKVTGAIHFRRLPGGIRVRLYRFPVDSSVLQSEHLYYLNAEAIPFLKADPVRTVFVWGLASTSGSEAHNLALSTKRAQRVYQYLRDGGVDASQLEQKFEDLQGLGEGPAHVNRPPEGAGSGYFRAVEIWLLNNILKRSFDSFTSREQLAPLLGLA